MKDGQVQSFNAMRGYGFIKLMEDSQVVFAHYSDILSTPQTLSKGEIVLFDVKEVQLGLQAVNITRKFLPGQIKAYYPERGYGFIARQDNKPDIYFHVSALISGTYQALHEGITVTFVEGRNERGPIALNIIMQDAVFIQQNGDQSFPPIFTPNSSNGNRNSSSAVSPQAIGRNIQSVGLKNFKAFGELVTLNLQPITILAGLNSRGKSSILDALLLLKQTLLTEKRVGERISLNINGAFFKVNQFVEMIYGKNVNDALLIRFVIPCRFTSSSASNSPIVTLLHEQTDDILVQVDFTFTQANSFVSDKVVSESISFRAFDTNQQLLYQLTITEFRYDEEYAEVKVKVESPNSIEFDATDIIRFSFFLPFWETNALKSSASQKEKEKFEVYTRYQTLFQSAVETIQQELLSHVKYLGPLREEPLREYTIKPLPKDDIGAKGENTVIVLQQNWDKLVRFVQLPDHHQQVVSWQHLSAKDMTLGEAINQALWWLGMQELKTEAIGNTVQASFSTASSSDTKVTIADVGFGVSQILPVLALGLLAEPNSILILEQPEIHLHPQAQAKLAEIFLCFSYLGYRLLIETHSDHLINRMRRLVAEDASDQLHKTVNIVFVHQNNEHSLPTLEELKVNEEGRIVNWPAGFLAETADDARAIVQASITKKRQKLLHQNGTIMP